MANDINVPALRNVSEDIENENNSKNSNEELDYSKEKQNDSVRNSLFDKSESY